MGSYQSNSDGGLVSDGMTPGAVVLTREPARSGAFTDLPAHYQPAWGMQYVRFPISLRNVEDLLFERGYRFVPRDGTSGSSARSVHGQPGPTIREFSKPTFTEKYTPTNTGPLRARQRHNAVLGGGPDEAPLLEPLCVERHAKVSGQMLRRCKHSIFAVRLPGRMAVAYGLEVRWLSGSCALETSPHWADGTHANPDSGFRTAPLAAAGPIHRGPRKA